MEIGNFNPLDPDFIRAPYETLKQLRDTTPVCYVKALDVYLVTSYDLVRAVMTNPAMFSSMLNRRASISEEGIRIITEAGFGRDLPALQNNDPPSHTIFRQFANQAFRPKRIRQMSEYIDKIAHDLIDDIIRSGDTTEAFSSFAAPLPMIVIAEQIGMPRENYKTFKQWSEAWLTGVGNAVPEAELVAAAHLVVEMQRYLAARVGERRGAPREDILSDLANFVGESGDTLDVQQILSLVEQFLVAGNETTSSGITSGLRLLAGNKDLQHELRAKPERMADFTEELLRTEPPVFGMLRRTVKATELGGVPLPKDSTVLAHFGAANRDPQRFSHPDRFDLDRPEKGAHLAFGSGIHHCVGSELARVEMRASFRSFLERFCEFDLIDAEAHYLNSFLFRLETSLRLRVKPI